MIRFILNETEINTALPPGMVLLDFIRYHQHLTGTKIGCREGDCGACTILVGQINGDNIEYRSMTSCLMPMANAHGKHIVTIEGINFPGSELNPIQQAMADEGATQCGFCTPGFVMSLAGFCLTNREITNANAIAAIDGNICRCTGYKSIERACARVVHVMNEKIQDVEPGYFPSVKKRLLQWERSNGQLASSDATSHTFVGGGTDLYVQKHDEMKEIESRFVFDHSGMNGITKAANKIFIGPSATVTDLKNSEIIRESFPDFDQYAWLVSSTPIRNMATIAGNFVNASPIGDFTIFFLALDAQLVLSDGKTQREVPLRNFYKGYKQLDKKPREYIEQIWFNLPPPNFKFSFEKVSKRTNLDIATVNSALAAGINNAQVVGLALSAGGVGPTPMYLKKTSEFLNGKKITEDLVIEAIAIAQTEIAPISDARGSAAYKRLLLGQLIKAHFIKLFPALDVKELIRIAES